MTAILLYFLVEVKSRYEIVLQDYGLIHGVVSPLIRPWSYSQGGLTSGEIRYYLRHEIFTAHVHLGSNYIKVVYATPYFTYSM